MRRTAVTVIVSSRSATELKAPTESRRESLFLSERLIHGRDERTEQVIERSALFGRHHHGRAHTRIQFELPGLLRPGKVIFINLDKSCEIGRLGLRISQPVG